MKLPFLILFFLVLSGAGESGEPNPSSPSRELRPDKHKETPKEQKDATENQAEPTSPTAFEKSLVETLRTIADQQQTDSEQNDASHKSWNTPSVLVQIGLLIVGAVYSFFAILQWRAIQRQANIMVASERAWVGVHFKQLYALGGDFVDVEIFNSGKSPGHIKAVKLIGFEVVDKDKPVSYKPKSAPPSRMGTAWTIFPGESTTQRWDVRLEPEQITEVARKTKRLPLFGFVWYEDVFGNRHVTNFCRDWMEVDEPLKGRFMIPPDAESGQNEAT